MRQATRTVHYATLSNVSSYSSGPLYVGDLDDLLISLSATDVVGHSGGTAFIDVSIVDANGNLGTVASLTANAFSPACSIAVIGEHSSAFNGSTFSGYAVDATNSGIPYFGDQMQLDLRLTGTVTAITAQVAVKGK